MDNLIWLVASEAKMAVKPEDSLEDRCRTAMKAASNHWMVLDPDLQFKGAVVAVLETASEDERQRITDDLQALNTLSALLSGVSVDFDAIDIPENPLGLRLLWQEVTA